MNNKIPVDVLKEALENLPKPIDWPHRLFQMPYLIKSNSDEVEMKELFFAKAEDGKSWEFVAN